MRYVLILLLFSFNCDAQTLNFQLLDADNSNTVVINNTTYSHTVMANFSSTRNFSVNNNSASTQTVIVKRYIQYLNTINASDKADAPFSYALINYAPMTYSAIASAAPGGKIHFDANLYEASIAGPSEVHYKFMDATDTTKFIKIIMKYNVTTTGLFDNKSDLETRVSPNPVKTGDVVKIISSLKIKLMELIDVNGKVVGNWVGPSTSSGTTSISTKDLAPGVYFLKLDTEKGIGIKKLIIDP